MKPNLPALRPEAPNRRWIQVPDFPYYYISSDGLVWSERKQLLLVQMKPHGYHKCVLQDKGRIQSFFVSRLMLTLFKGPPPDPKMQAAHLDGIKANNVLSNLKWVTQKENCDHKILHGTDISGKRHPMRKLSKKEIIEIKRQYIPPSGFPRRSNSIELANKYGVHKGTISRIIKYDISKW